MQGQEQFQGQIQNQFQKVKRLCVALSTLSKSKKISANLCVKTTQLQPQIENHTTSCNIHLLSSIILDACLVLQFDLCPLQ